MSKSPSLRRIQADVRELALDPSDRYYAAPLEDDMFEWHFTIRGADGTDFEGGVYHGRILLPPEYPFKPPHIVFLTPSGRFETGTKVCLSFSAYHPELWQPAWGIRLILEALISFLPTPADGAIGALDWTSDERKRLAKKSVSFCCPRCGKTASLLPELKPDSEKKTPSKFEKEIEKLRLLQIQNEGKPKKDEKEKTNEAATEDAASAEGNRQSSEASPAETNEKAKTAASHENEVKETPKSEQEEEPVAVPSSAPARVAPASPATTTSTEPVARPADSSSLDVSWLTDPVLHAIIVVLAILCILLVRKWIALADELRSLSDAGM